jgi:hypothetical protein
MPESEQPKPNSSADPKRTEFDRFKALASALLKVPNSNIGEKNQSGKNSEKEKSGKP